MSGPGEVLLFGGLAIGLALGVVIQRSRFCMVSALTDAVLLGEYRRVQAYFWALGAAVLGTLAIESGGLVAMAESGFRAPRVDWIGAIAGGLAFGVGAVLAGGCAGRTLVNAAEGNLGSALALGAFAVAAYVAQFGFLEPLHGALVRSTAWSFPTGDASLPSLLGVNPWLAGGAVAALCLAAAGRWCVKGDTLEPVATGLLLGALVVAAWWTTGHLAASEFEPGRPESLSFSGALARIVLDVKSGHVVGSPFGPTLVAGTAAGAAASAVLGRTFHWVRPPRERAGYYVSGGLLMGVGAAFAGGCNIGNALSGVSALSVRALMATIAIFCGMRLGLAWLQRLEAPDGEA